MMSHPLESPSPVLAPPAPARLRPGTLAALARRGRLVILVLLAGCGFGDTGETPPPADSAAVDTAGVSGPPPLVPPPAAGADTGATPGDTATAGAAGDTTGSASDTGGSPAAADTPGPADARPPADTTSAGEVRDTTLAGRLDRLEAENDSLRSALGVLLNQWGGRPAGDDTSAAADSAQGVLGLETGQVRHWGLRIFLSLVFLALAGLLVRGTVWVLDRLSERDASRRLLFKRLVPIARILIWTLMLVFVALVVLEVDAQGLVAAGAAVGVAVGFAAQDILKNVFGGLIVLFDQPFQVGDKISVGGTYGEVVSIGLRSTRIVTPDDNLVSVPNAQVVGDQVANANAGELNCQVVTDLYLPGHADEALAKRIAFEAATGSRYLYRKKPVVVLVRDEFRETFLTHVMVKAYVLDPRMEFLFRSDVTERARAAFREAGLVGPFHGVRGWFDLDPAMEKVLGRGGEPPAGVRDDVAGPETAS